MTLSPTERQRARDLCEGPDWRVRTVIRELEGIVSAAPSSAAKKRTRTTVLYEALWASRGYDAARTLVPRLLAALEEAEAEVAALNERLAEHQKADDQVVGQVVELTAENAALKKGVSSLMESRKKWKRRAAGYRLWKRRAEKSEAEVERRDAMIERFMGAYDCVLCGLCGKELTDRERGPFKPMDEAFADIRAHVAAKRHAPRRGARGGPRRLLRQYGGPMSETLPMDAVLCYVDGAWAWFTTQPLADQWGDDWNDAPYEHNAGDPSGPAILYYADGRSEPAPRDHHPDGSPKWRVFRVAWEGPFETPEAWRTNSPYSVVEINAGAVPWLAPDRYGEPHGVHIDAGTPLAEFLRLVRSAGGTVYLPVSR